MLCLYIVTLMFKLYDLSLRHSKLQFGVAIEANLQR